MRVSSSMAYTEFNRNLSTNQANLQKYQNQLSTLNQYSKSSDNPLVFAKIINIGDSITQNKFYNETIGDAISWTNTQDKALSNATDSLHRIRTLIQSSATGTQGAAELAANKSEIIAEVEGLVDALNTNFDGRYIFGGQNTKTPPFEVIKNAQGDITEVKYHGTTSKPNANLSREIAKGVDIELISDGRLLVNEKGTTTSPDNFGSFVNDVLTALNTDDKDSLSGNLLTKVDQHTENFVTVRTRIGTLSNRLTAAKDRNENENLSLQSVLADKQEVDIAQKYMEFSNEMVAYQASLSMGTKIMQASILDYV